MRLYETKTMTKQTALVTLDGLHDPRLPAVMNIPRTKAEMSKSAWLEWLEKSDRFKFEGSDGSKFTAYKSPKHYWTAQRRVDGKLRHEYMGSSSDLTYETLDQTARKMNMKSSAYWREKYPDPRAEQETKAESHTKNYETESKVSAQNAAEIEKLKQQLTETQKAIADLKHQLKQETQRADDAVYNGLKAATLLHEALKLKANAGGAIKLKIKQALALIDDI
jgi:uncharacterized coiled-coil protein SlyX